MQNSCHSGETPVLEHTITFVKLPLFCQNGIAEENQPLGNVGEIRCDQRADISETSVTEVITMIKHRDMAGERKNYPL
jgi:hypothetical protein